ncbi:hypothetical protein P872_08710 [Rhodonellum psychrophilum GCM71 = DSM 17998]|uniref:Uncharacterized protein n=2 Tax=Rhodonellum TaxID=336827 RepID=U5BWV3_9BACT|nr:hypothetical protein P872_08710 [Rhodonellum psychrophilum GCM71 = DSM 17998]
MAKIKQIKKGDQMYACFRRPIGDLRGPEILFKDGTNGEIYFQLVPSLRLKEENQRLGDRKLENGRV